MRIEDKLDLDLSWTQPRIGSIAGYDIGALIKMLGDKDMVPETSLKTVVYETRDQPRVEATVPLRTEFHAEDNVTVIGYMLRGPHRGTHNNIEIKMENSPRNDMKCIRIEFAVVGYVGPYSSEHTKAETAELSNSFKTLKDILLKCNRR